MGLVDWVRKWATLPRRWRLHEEHMHRHAVAAERFNGYAARMGYGAYGPMQAATEIAVRCRGAEWELKRVSLRLERLQAEQAHGLDLDGPPYLAPAEIERLAMLAEECGETIQAVGKVLRHGWESQSPYGGVPNRVNLEREIGNVRAVVNLMLHAEDVRLSELQTWQRTKRAKLPKWTHHQADSLPREEQLAMMREIESARLEK